MRPYCARNTHPQIASREYRSAYPAQAEGGIVATFIVLGKFTQQELQNAKDGQRRGAAARCARSVAFVQPGASRGAVTTGVSCSVAATLARRPPRRECRIRVWLSHKGVLSGGFNSVLL